MNNQKTLIWNIELYMFANIRNKRRPKHWRLLNLTLFYDIRENLFGVVHQTFLSANANVNNS